MRTKWRDITIQKKCEGRGIAGKNTAGAGKLLFFELTRGRAFEDGETRLSGTRDGEWRGKFRGIYRLRGHAAHGLAAPRAGRELGRTGGGAVFEPIAAQAAGRR